MALFLRLQTLNPPPHIPRRQRPPVPSAVRLLSFAAPEEAAAERRRRKRRLRALASDCSKLGQAVDLKDDMLSRGLLRPDPTLELFSELKEELGGGPIDDGIVYGNLMKAYFNKGMEAEAMGVYEEALGEGSKVRFDASSYNLVLEALVKNGRIEEGVRLFDRMMGERAVDLGSFNVMVDAYSAASRCMYAIKVFRMMGRRRCSPDTLSYDSLVRQLAACMLLKQAEKLYLVDGWLEFLPDEYTHYLLMDACFDVGRADAATSYFHSYSMDMTHNVYSYNRVMGGLVRAGRLDEAREYFDLMVENETTPNQASYEMLVKAFVMAGRLDDALRWVKCMLSYEGLRFSEEMKELVESALREQGRGGDMARLYEEVEMDKAKALARAEEDKARWEEHNKARKKEERNEAEEAGTGPVVCCGGMSACACVSACISTHLDSPVDRPKLDQAVDLKDGMLSLGLPRPDPTLCNLRMSVFVKEGEPDRALELFRELKGKLGGGPVDDGIVYGSLMKAYFSKGMEAEAMGVYEEALGEGSEVRFDAAGYNLVLEALVKNGKLEEGVRLFDRMKGEHSPPRRPTVNLGSFNVMVDAYCAASRRDEAVEVFRMMGEKNIFDVIPDTPSYNNLIRHLVYNTQLEDAEWVYARMDRPDDYTYFLLMGPCFHWDKVDRAIYYFEKIVEPGLNSYNRVMGGLAHAGRPDEAWDYFDLMVEKGVKPNLDSYEPFVWASVAAGRLDDALKAVKGILSDEGLSFSEELKGRVEAALREKGRGEDMARVYEEVERDKAEALARGREEEERKQA